MDEQMERALDVIATIADEAMEGAGEPEFSNYSKIVGVAMAGLGRRYRPTHLKEKIDSR